MIDFAVSSLVNADSFDFSLTSSRTSFTIFLILVFVDLLRIRLTSFWRARFNADLWLANFQLTPFYKILYLKMTNL